MSCGASSGACGSASAGGVGSVGSSGGGCSGGSSSVVGCPSGGTKSGSSSSKPLSPEEYQARKEAEERKLAESAARWEERKARAKGRYHETTAKVKKLLSRKKQ